MYLLEQPKSWNSKLEMLFPFIRRLKGLSWSKIREYYLPFNQPLTLRLLLSTKRGRYLLASIVDFILIIAILFNGMLGAGRFLTPLISPLQPLSASVNKGSYEVFGFAPYWTFDKLSNVNFNTLTTFAYFGVEVGSDGNLDKEGAGYQTFRSSQATSIFKKAHANGTRVVLTLTQMDDSNIEDLMDDPGAQKIAINQAVAEVKNRGIDGINVDFEYAGDPGQSYRDKFSKFIADLTSQMHRSIPQSKVTVSVYASAVKEPKIYDIAALGKSTDGIFMMAYDFAVAGSQNAIPTAPLHGHQDGTYWYDISTAVDDFLTQVTPNKLILGVPYYGYNYVVDSPTVKAATYPYYSKAQMYETASSLGSGDSDIQSVKTGWDSEGEVGWKAYYVPSLGEWRMIFLDDAKSLGLKYDFAKGKHLAGVGIWALGFDGGKDELWKLLSDEFGQKIADNSVFSRVIGEVYADEPR